LSDTNNNTIDAVMSRMLEPAGLEEQHLNKTLDSMLHGGVDFADLYFQVNRQESWTVEDGILREGSFSLEQGVGVRAISGEKTGLAYSDELFLPALQHAAGAARAIARQGGSQQLQAWSRGDSPRLYSATDPTRSISDEQKTAMLAEVVPSVSNCIGNIVRIPERQHMLSINSAPER
jgi:TldD protein